MTVTITLCSFCEVKNGVKHLYNRFYPKIGIFRRENMPKKPYFNLDDVLFPIF